ncbi:diguanylate cyclase, partial [bacterium]|nr:diguanylate cyclase [bacterium]
MTRCGQNRSILAGIYILILCLLFLGRGSENAHHFALLLWPLIMLAGYWEDTPGALIVTILGAITAVTGSLLGVISHGAAVADIIAMGLIFGLTMMLSRDWEVLLKAHKDVRTPLERDLAKVERKARLIREQLEEYESRLKELIKLYEGAKRLLGILELHPVLTEARSLVAQSLPRHFGSQADKQVQLAFYIPEEGTGDFQKVEVRGHEILDMGFPEKLPSSDLHRKPDKLLNPLRVEDLTLDPRLKVLAGDTTFHALMIIPLIMHEREIGIMMLASHEVSAFSAADFNQMEILGKQIVFALRKTLLYHKVQTLSITDSLTGLYVHRHFQERLREEIRRAERYNQFLSLIMLDLDHFKRVNDQHGHQVGDAVLSETAARLREQAGSTA